MDLMKSLKQFAGNKSKSPAVLPPPPSQTTQQTPQPTQSIVQDQPQTQLQQPEKIKTPKSKSPGNEVSSSTIKEINEVIDNLKKTIETIFSGHENRTTRSASTDTGLTQELSMDLLMTGPSELLAHVDALRDLTSKMNVYILKIESDKTSLNTEISNLNSQISQSNQQCETKNNDFTNAINSLNQEKIKLNDQIVNLKNEITQLQVEINKQEGLIDDLNVNIKEAKEKNIKLYNELNNEKSMSYDISKIESLYTDLSQAIEINSTLKNDLDHNHELYTKLSNDYNTLKTEYQSIFDQNQSLKESTSTLTSKLESLDKKYKANIISSEHSSISDEETLGQYRRIFQRYPILSQFIGSPTWEVRDNDIPPPPGNFDDPVYKNVFQYWNVSDFKKNELWGILTRLSEGKIDHDKQTYVIDNLEEDILTGFLMIIYPRLRTFLPHSHHITVKVLNKPSIISTLKFTIKPKEYDESRCHNNYY